MIDIDLLRAVPVLNNVKKDEQEILIRAFQKKTFPINGRLFQDGDSAEWVGWIVKGTVGIRHGVSDYNNGIIGPGEVIAERALLLNTKTHNQTAVALTETTIIQLSLTALKKLKKESIDTYSCITALALGDISSRLSHSTNKLFAVHEISELMNAPSLSLSLFGKRMLDIIASVITIEAGICGIFNPFNQSITIIALKNSIPPSRQSSIPLEHDHLLLHTLQSRRITLISSDEIQKSPQWYLSHNGLIAPLSNQKKLLGVIILSHKLASKEFTENNYILMEIIASMASSKIDEFSRIREQAAQEEHKQTSV